MKAYSWLLIAAIMGSVICTVIVNPTGEGFVRGYNVVFTLIISSAIVWGMTLPAIGFLVMRWVKAKDIKVVLRQERQVLLLVALGSVAPLLNAFIVRIKSALEYL